MVIRKRFCKEGVKMRAGNATLTDPCDCTAH